jgi:hypothetical protein
MSHHDINDNENGLVGFFPPSVLFSAASFLSVSSQLLHRINSGNYTTLPLWPIEKPYSKTRLGFRVVSSQVIAVMAKILSHLTLEERVLKPLFILHFGSRVNDTCRSLGEKGLEKYLLAHGEAFLQIESA